MAGSNAFQALMSAPPRPQPQLVAPRSNGSAPIAGQSLQTLIGGPGSLKPDAETAWGERTNAERPGGREITGEEMEQREARRQQAKEEIEASRARCLQVMREANALRNRVTTADTENPPVPDPKYDAFLARANILDEKLADYLQDPTIIRTQSADIKRLMEQNKSLETELTASNSTSNNIRELSEALSTANAELESLRSVWRTLGQVKTEKDSLHRENDSLRQEMNTLQQEKNSIQREKDSLQQEKNSLQCEFKKTQDNLTDMSHVQVQLATTQDLLQQVLQRQQTTVTGSPSTTTSVAGQGAAIGSSVPLDDHHRTGGVETPLGNVPESSSGGKRPVTDPVTRPNKRPRLEEPDLPPPTPDSPQAGPSTSGLAREPNGEPDVQPGQLPAAAVPDYTFLKEVVNPYESPNLPNSLWTKAQLPIGVTATVDAAMMGWSVKKSDWATPRKTSGNCVDSHLNKRRLLKLSDGESYACRRCVDNKQPCVVVPKASKPVVLPLPPSKRPPNATWQGIGFWVKG